MDDDQLRQFLKQQEEWNRMILATMLPPGSMWLQLFMIVVCFPAFMWLLGVMYLHP